jgi:hypothetical protein
LIEKEKQATVSHLFHAWLMLVFLRNTGGTDMSAHDSEHAHHEPEDESIGVKVGIFFICVLITLFLIAL